MKYGGAYHGGGKKNNSGGATQSKSGTHLVPLCRAAGYSQTEAAMSSKKGSQYPATSKHYQYEDAGSGTAGNTIGWSPE